MNSSEEYLSLAPYLVPGKWQVGANGIAACAIPNPSTGLLANRYYFDNPDWAEAYLKSCHRDQQFADRWRQVVGNWDGKVVVDIGCGPGNLYAVLGGTPGLLLGVDVSAGALEMARKIGYVPLMADAHQLRLVSAFADIVALNATLHHCDNMPTVLTEAARLVRPGGGLLITDQDPQLTAWNWRGIGMLLYKLRLPLYRILCHGDKHEQVSRMATELHHIPGHGVTPDLYYDILKPLGFEVQVYPHNNTLGAKVLEGHYGRAVLKYRVSQRLSGIDPNSLEGALSLMCVACKH